MPRATAAAVPRHAGLPGALSGRQRRQGRKPAFGGGRGRKEDDVFRLCRPHRTHRPAIDPGGSHPGEKHAVEARIARNARAIAGLPIQRQALIPPRHMAKIISPAMPD